MGGGARALVRQLKTAVFLRKSLKPGGSKSVKCEYDHYTVLSGVISRQLILKISKMQPTLSDFYEIWYACRTSLPDSKYTNFFKIGQVELKL